MNDVVPMRFFQHYADLTDYFRRHLWRERPALADDLAKALAFDQFHHEIKQPVFGHAEVVDHHRVRVLESRCGLSLAAESLDRVRIAHYFKMKYFDCNIVAYEQSSGAIDCAHAARAYFFLDPISIPDRCANKFFLPGEHCLFIRRLGGSATGTEANRFSYFVSAA